ncbi:MAG: DUF711 family protein [Chloroflexi bacterium]|nr:DUF711 family protein [Chloroflexota bacterium]
MQIRSITLGVEAAWPLPPSTCRDAGAFLEQARRAFEQDGFGVQTTRLCTQSAHRFLLPAALPGFARALEAACAAAGIEYAAVGGIALDEAWTELATAEAVVLALRATERVFSSIQLAARGQVDYGAARAAATVICRIAANTEQGFGNLRFAAYANCPPNTPFFPAAYHAGGPARFSLALQAADLVVDAFSGPGSLEAAEARLVSALERLAARLEPIAASLEQRLGVAYAGLDLSPAPFPSDPASVAGGLEALGLERFGGAGTLHAAWRLTGALKRARVRRCGFSGLMLPLLEDAVLARRAAEGLLSVSELLLFSSVCGTGLDTVPLPGDVGEDEVAGILLDVAALATALQKPLTARLFPVPGKQAGELTEFTFPYFANSRVLPVKGYGAAELVARAVDDGR